MLKVTEPIRINVGIKCSLDSGGMAEYLKIKYSYLCLPTESVDMFFSALQIPEIFIDTQISPKFYFTEENRLKINLEILSGIISAWNIKNEENRNLTYQESAFIDASLRKIGIRDINTLKREIKRRQDTERIQERWLEKLTLLSEKLRASDNEIKPGKQDAASAAPLYLDALSRLGVRENAAHLFKLQFSTFARVDAGKDTAGLAVWINSQRSARIAALEKSLGLSAPPLALASVPGQQELKIYKESFTSEQEMKEVLGTQIVTDLVLSNDIFVKVLKSIYPFSNQNFIRQFYKGGDRVFSLLRQNLKELRFADISYSHVENLEKSVAMYFLRRDEAIDETLGEVSEEFSEILPIIAPSSLGILQETLTKKVHELAKAAEDLGLYPNSFTEEAMTGKTESKKPGVFESDAPVRTSMDIVPEDVHTIHPSFENMPEFDSAIPVADTGEKFISDFDNFVVLPEAETVDMKGIPEGFEEVEKELYITEGHEPKETGEAYERSSFENMPEFDSAIPASDTGGKLISDFDSLVALQEAETVEVKGIPEGFEEAEKELYKTEGHEPKETGDAYEKSFVIEERVLKSESVSADDLIDKLSSLGKEPEPIKKAPEEGEISVASLPDEKASADDISSHSGEFPDEDVQSQRFQRRLERLDTIERKNMERLEKLQSLDITREEAKQFRTDKQKSMELTTSIEEISSVLQEPPEDRVEKELYKTEKAEGYEAKETGDAYEKSSVIEEKVLKSDSVSAGDLIDKLSSLGEEPEPIKKAPEKGEISVATLPEEKASADDISSHRGEFPDEDVQSQRFQRWLERLDTIERKNMERLEKLQSLDIKREETKQFRIDKQKSMKLATSIEEISSVLQELPEDRIEKINKISPEAEAILNLVDSDTRNFYEKLLTETPVQGEISLKQREALAESLKEFSMPPIPVHIKESDTTETLGSADMNKVSEESFSTPAESIGNELNLFHFSEGDILSNYNANLVTENIENPLMHNEYLSFAGMQEINSNRPASPNFSEALQLSHAEPVSLFFGEEIINRIENIQSADIESRIQRISEELIEAKTKDKGSSPDFRSGINLSFREIEDLVNTTFSKHMDKISARVYSNIEAKLKSERRRRGY